LPILDADLAPVLEQAAAGRLADSTCRFAPGTVVGVVLASGGYPDRYETGKPIAGLDEAASEDGVLLFHAGTARRDGQTVTAGGRVLTVVGRGSDYGGAMARAYAAAARISFDGMFYRKDIGRKAVTGS